MKFFIFIFVIVVFVMEDQKTFQATSSNEAEASTSQNESHNEEERNLSTILWRNAEINADRLMSIEHKKIEDVTLFKNYVLELVNAAAQPFRANFNIMKQGCACSSLIKDEKAFDVLNVIATSMMIANRHYDYLEKIRNARDGFTARDFIYKSEMEVIQKLVDELRNATDNFQLTATIADLKNYLTNYRTNPSLITKLTGALNFGIMTAQRCYELVFGIECNMEFFEKYLRGFWIVREWMKKPKDDGEPAELRTIIDEIRQSQLTNPPADYKKDEFDRTFRRYENTFLRNLDE